MALGAAQFDAGVILEAAARLVLIIIIIIIMVYIYHALINALNAHILHINLNTIFYTEIEDSPNRNNLHKALYAGTHTH